MNNKKNRTVPNIYIDVQNIEVTIAGDCWGFDNFCIALSALILAILVTENFLTNSYFR